MVRRLCLVLAAVVAVTLVPAAQALEQGKSRHSGYVAARTMTITVLSLTRVTVPHDTPPKGKENKGDWIEYKDLLLTTGPLFGKKKANQPVGWDGGTLTYTSATNARVRGEATFPGQGTIRFMGNMKGRADGSNTVPIVGGTGKFSGATGLLIIGPGNQQATNTYRLRLPGSTVA